jgi:hypothetical protein
LHRPHHKAAGRRFNSNRVTMSFNNIPCPPHRTLPMPAASRLRISSAHTPPYLRRHTRLESRVVTRLHRDAMNNAAQSHAQSPETNRIPPTPMPNHDTDVGSILTLMSHAERIKDDRATRSQSRSPSISPIRGARVFDIPQLPHHPRPPSAAAGRTGSWWSPVSRACSGFW